MPSGVGGLSWPAATCADPDGGFQENAGNTWRTYGPGGNGKRILTPCPSPFRGRFISSSRFFIFVVMRRAIVFIFGTIGGSVTEARIGHRELELLRKPYPLGGERKEFEVG